MALRGGIIGRAGLGEQVSVHSVIRFFNFKLLTLQPSGSAIIYIFLISHFRAEFVILFFMSCKIIVIFY